jgi:hypothetical protein
MEKPLENLGKGRPCLGRVHVITMHPDKSPVSGLHSIRLAGDCSQQVIRPVYVAIRLSGRTTPGFAPQVELGAHLFNIPDVQRQGKTTHHRPVLYHFQNQRFLRDFHSFHQDQSTTAQIADGLLKNKKRLVFLRRIFSLNPVEFTFS